MNTVNIIGRIDPAKKDTIGTKEITEQLKEQMDKYAGINVDDKPDDKHSICNLQYVLGDKGTTKTDCKGMTTTTNPLKKTMKDVEKINENNIGDELHEMLMNLDKNMKFAGQYFIIAHLPYDDSKDIKDGRMILAKFGNTGDKPESFTIYKKVTSQNNNITLGEPEEFTLDKDGNKYSAEGSMSDDSAKTGDDAIMDIYPKQSTFEQENPMRGHKLPTRKPHTRKPRATGTPWNMAKRRGGKSTRKKKSKRGTLKKRKTRRKK
jgi:hypothetical protein